MNPSDAGEFPPPSARDKAAAERLLRAAKAFHPPVTVTLAEIEAAARNQRRLGTGGARLLLAGAVAVVLFLVVGGVAVSRGWRGWIDWWPRSFPVAPVVNPPLPARTGAPRRGPAAPQPAPAPPSPAALPAPEVAPPAVPLVPEPVQRRRSRRAGPPPTLIASAAPTVVASAAPADGQSSPSPAAAEVTQLRDALKKLRADRDPATALSLLADHDQRFPTGLLHDEVSAMRIEALMALDRTDEALDRADALPDSLLARWPRLRILRGELRANHGRCPEATADFAALLSRAADDEIRRRAEAGRDACLGHRKKVDPAP